MVMELIHEHEPPSASVPDTPPGLVRVVLLVGDAAVNRSAQPRLGKAGRRALQARRRAQGEAAVPVIDEILSRHGGRRIGEVTSLGTVAVETTAEGIRMLRAMPAVQDVLDDQPLTLLH